MDPKASPFWRDAIRSGLVDAETLEACLGAIAPERRSPDALDRRLARQAIIAGKLTVWQAQQILLGRWKGLAIGKYALLGVLGRGGMGQVYLARDTRLGRPVAIKVLSRERSHSPRAMARFAREVTIAGQLQHEHLIRVYDDGEAFGFRFLVMEYIDGLNAAQMVHGGGPLPPASAAEVARQVASGLDYLDRKGLFHRDVTPSNILIDREGLAKLTDFGLAVHLDEPDVLTHEGATVGTFDYLSPEQARSSHGITIRSDIYSLGCCCYFMITGAVPFPANSLAETLMAHHTIDPEPIAALVPSCPPGLSAVVRRMMKKAPEDRYARPSEVVAALAPFASGHGPLSRIVSMGKGPRGPGSAGEAYAAEWVDTGYQPEGPSSGDGPRPSSSWVTQEVFPRVDDELALPLAPSSAADGRPALPPRIDAPWPVAVAALVLFASILALLFSVF